LLVFLIHLLTLSPLMPHAEPPAHQYPDKERHTQDAEEYLYHGISPMACMSHTVPLRMCMSVTARGG
jgi:hypothetical protein